MHLLTVFLLIATASARLERRCDRASRHQAIASATTPAIKEAVKTGAGFVQTATATAATSTSTGSKRGYAWAVDNSLAGLFNNKKPTWVYHWQMGPIPELSSSISYVPQLWGTSDLSDFQSVMGGLTQLPDHILAFNEPDLSSQSNMSPQAAAAAYQKYIQPYAAKGVKLGAPAIAWNTDWLQQFFDACDGCTFDFIPLHWYGDYNGQETFQNYVAQIHSQFSKYSDTIWVTEWGATASSGGSEQQVLQFLQDTTGWLESQDYVERISFFGMWSQNPDGYASNFCAFVNSDGSLTQAGQFWTSG